MNALTPPTQPVQVITAGAGSGKTYAITTILKDAVDAGVPPEAIIATTFTKKAAAELSHRVQLRLLEGGRVYEAAALPDSLIGTVNSVCGRLLSDYAFEAGLSPALNVLSDGEQVSVFRRAIGPIIEHYAEDIEPIAARLSLIEPPGARTKADREKDWRDHVFDTVQGVRNNLLDDAMIDQSCERSVSSLLDLLPAPMAIDPEHLDEALHKAIAQALTNIGDGDGTKTTKDALKSLREAARSIEGDEGLPYAKWVSLAKIKASRPYNKFLDPVRAAARVYDSHPRLRQDLKAYIELCFSCAKAALHAYRALKAREGLLDFCDQETLTYELLAQPAICQALSSRIRLMVVDEFQDTSPIQLALFTRLAGCAGRSAWVGDPKQAIYGFRGTDPELMNAAVNVLGLDPKNVLRQSRRSRPPLVQLANWLFTPAFGANGMPEDRVRLEPVRHEDPGFAAPVHVWSPSSARADNRLEEIAGEIVDLLNNPDRMPVKDAVTEQMRPCRPGDIAVLCRQNDTLEKLAGCLSRRGVRVAVEWAGLLQTDEARLAVAALRYLLSADDTLAVAQILHLTGEGQNSDWLYEWLSEGQDKSWKNDPRIVRLDAARANLITMTPREAMDAAIGEAQVVRSVASWPFATQRLANLDALRALVGKYEEHCRSARLAGTTQGLVSWLNEIERDPKANQQPAAAGDDAVTLVTYHGAKGLEWPIVVLTELSYNALDKTAKRMFGAKVCSDGPDFDLAAPLKGRHIRLWPWPFAAHKTVEGVTDTLISSEAYRLAHDLSFREEIRLLYVGVTRARDYIVFTGQRPDEPGDEAAKSPTPWLDLLGNHATRLFALPPSGCSLLSLTDGDIEVETRVLAGNGAAYDVAQHRYLAELPEGEGPWYKPMRLAPSSATGTPAPADHLRVDDLGQRLLHKSSMDDFDRIGSAIHAYLGAENRSAPVEDRLDLAFALTQRWGVENALKLPDLVTASDRLHTFLVGRYGGYAVLREWPVHRRDADGQEMVGYIDMLVEHEGGIAIIDHKSFPGGEAQWRSKAASYAPQLQAYKVVVEEATGRPVTDLLIHMPIAGAIVHL
ncbi:UvrD-helicase domain-containing protein [Microvirga aerilata]|uniref:DNA 3'-5' helicase n=1 Tax=Microvirga aerilata TaxID=670292 RepID=A0A937CZ99_9HYPH|nr:UvrD-helicase domain-containing protein [Microvirga aerilata]MBL0404461.1 UvrD-helicase domain-containing protein [Microvirga aerilata]